MLNKIALQGYIATEIDLRTTATGAFLASFSLSVPRDFKNKSGSRETDFMRVIAWRDVGEFISRYFKKGDMIVIDGRLQRRDYDDRDGNRKTIYEVVANNAYFCGKTEPRGKPHFEEPLEEMREDGELPF